MLGGLLGISFSASAWNDDGYGIAYDKGAVRRGDGGGNTTDMSGWHCEEVKRCASQGGGEDESPGYGGFGGYGPQPHMLGRDDNETQGGCGPNTSNDPLRPNCVSARGTNLANEDARRHTSFVKDLAPLPGISGLLGIRASY